MEPLSSSEEDEKKPESSKKKSKFMTLREAIPEEIFKSWEKYYFIHNNKKKTIFREQSELVGKIKEFDDFTWTPKSNQPNSLRYVFFLIQYRKK